MASAHRFNFTPVLLAALVGSGMAGAMIATDQPVSTGTWRLISAATAAALGVGAIYFALQNLQRARTTVPTPETGYLITEGIFSFTRNPVCLGLVFLLFGLAKIFETPWGYGAPALFFVLVHWLHIRPEEAALAARYGEQYLAYKARVRRWV